MTTKYEFEIEIPLPSKKMAEIIKKSLDPENYVYVKLFVKENILVAKGHGEDAGSILHTIDDLFWCLLVAYESLNVLSKNRLGNFINDS